MVILQKVKVYNVPKHPDLVLIENEKYFLAQGEIPVRFENNNKLEFETPPSSQLKTEIKNQFTILESNIENISNESKVYRFASDSQEKIDIWVQNKQKLTGFLKIQNALISERKIDIKPTKSEIQLPHQNCMQIFQLKSQFFLTFCQSKNKNEVILSVIENNGRIVDETIFKKNSSCKQKIAIYMNYCLYYEIGCDQFLVQRLEINFDTFQFIKESQYYFQNFEENNSGPLSALHYCSNNKVISSFPEKTTFTLTLRTIQKRNKL